MLIYVNCRNQSCKQVQDIANTYANCLYNVSGKTGINHNLTDICHGFDTVANQRPAAVHMRHELSSKLKSGAA